MNTRKTSISPLTFGNLLLLVLKYAIRFHDTLKPVVIEWAIRALRAAEVCASEFRPIERLAPARQWLKSVAFCATAGQVAEVVPPSGNQLAAFQENGRFGLRTADEQILLPEYNAVWPMLSGKFWGFRKGVAFGVIAADGTEVVSCSLPARFQGYRELGAEDEHRALQVSETRFLSHLREQHPGLHITG